LNDLFYDYEKIRDRIGIKQLNDDNKSFKKMMLNTQKKLYDLQQEYIWVIIWMVV
jgi:ASC-1-like (ASCH) protein